ncbi:MAG: cysteine desulfurase [Candidatus Pacebacteria bacterium]|nr:cysteine desulfurase [Candidatus Paceibacterota bacterium]
MNNSQQNKRVYLDWAAATPLSDRPFTAMEPFLRVHYGNPSSIHQEGGRARQAVNTAREQIASAVQVKPERVTFTGGGTEGNNLSIFGVIESTKQTGIKYSDMELITTKIEHPSVIGAVEKLRQLGVSVNYVNVTDLGLIDLNHLQELLSDKTVLVSCAYANSEIGTVQPIRAIRKIIRTKEEEAGTLIYFHVDAAQAPLWLSCQFDSTGADFLVLDAAKCCGPKGVGVLIQSKRAKLLPVTFGGGQEQGIRPGTENVSGIVGAGIAIQDAQSTFRERADKVTRVRDEGIAYLKEKLPTAILNGAAGEDRLANNINISIPKLDTEYTAVVLDSKGFAVSTKSACAGAGGGESKVVKEISQDSGRATATLRLSLGPETTIEEVREAVNIIAAHTERMQELTQ